MTRDADPANAVERTVHVPWPPDVAFRRFTTDFARWWPSATHSIGGRRLVDAVVFQCHVGGLIFERFKDGRRFKWGTVTAFDAPNRVSFTWHPSKDEHVAQDVDVTFTAEGEGTRVSLRSTGWERLGASAARARRMYSVGWGSILNVFAERRDMAIVVFAVLSHTITMALRLTGRLNAEIDRAGGRMNDG